MPEPDIQGLLEFLQLCYGNGVETVLKKTSEDDDNVFYTIAPKHVQSNFTLCINNILTISRSSNGEAKWQVSACVASEIGLDFEFQHAEIEKFLQVSLMFRDTSIDKNVVDDAPYIPLPHDAPPPFKLPSWAKEGQRVRCKAGNYKGFKGVVTKTSVASSHAYTSAIVVESDDHTGFTNLWISYHQAEGWSPEDWEPDPILTAWERISEDDSV